MLDYLTDMGGYTGFTEEELKGAAKAAGAPDESRADTVDATAERLTRRDMDQVAWSCSSSQRCARMTRTHAPPSSVGQADRRAE